MKNVYEIIEKSKLVPVIKIKDKNKALKLANALLAGGCSICEITLRTDNALDAIEEIKKYAPKMCVGAGTVLNIEQAKKAIEIGCDFIVSPGFDEEICKYFISKNVPVFPGCVTCTEIMQALKLGLNILKFFPSESFGGIKTIKAISAPFSNVKFMPTGGIDLNNIYAYLELPSVIACGGSFIASEKMIDEDKFDEITLLTKDFYSKL